MKTFASLLIAALLSVGFALAEDTALVDLTNALADQASLAHDAAQPPEDGPRPPRFKNWQLRGTMKDIRKISLSLRDRAARDKARGMIGRLKVRRLLANMQTANFLVAHGGARGLDAFPPAWEATRGVIGDVVAEMCCGGDDGDAGDKSAR